MKKKEKREKAKLRKAEDQSRAEEEAKNSRFILLTISHVIISSLYKDWFELKLPKANDSSLLCLHTVFSAPGEYSNYYGIYFIGHIFYCFPNWKNLSSIVRANCRVVCSHIYNFKIWIYICEDYSYDNKYNKIHNNNNNNNNNTTQHNNNKYILIIYYTHTKTKRRSFFLIAAVL